MSDKPSEELQSRDAGRVAEKSRSGFIKKLRLPKLTRKRLLVGVVLVVGLTSALAIHMFRPNALSLEALRNVEVLQSFLSANQNDGALQADHKPVFSNSEAGDLISSETVLGIVGRNPVDPTRILIANFGRNGAHAANLLGDSTAESPELESEQQKPNDPVAPVFSTGPPIKQEPEEAPTGDSESAAVASDSREKSGRQAAARTSDKNEGTVKPSTDKDKEVVASAVPESKPKPAVTYPPAVTGVRVTPRSEETSSSQSKPVGADAKDQKKLEDYQLPGSLVVDMKNYRGKPIPWGLMVILDDSTSMGKKTKTWKPSRMNAAIRFVKGISHIISPGSQIAIRDFPCPKEQRRRGRARRCKSELLSDWSLSPFAELKQKLGEVAPIGINIPCAAIATTVKENMLGLKKLYPRVVIITGGASRCRYGLVLKALRSAKSDRPVRIDVVGVGMPRKNRKAYKQLALRNDGAIFYLDKPSQVKRELSKYKKILRAKNMEEIEVRGDEAVKYGAVGDEITLAPGTYTVTLPEVPGLGEAQRTLPKKVTIESGKNRRLKVSVRKGRLKVRDVN